ncbi:MAG TPA: ComF family protein [Xanthomonadaceae bacterium]|nr:ComF family protein [Xanthomonadaceae bacterium]
MNGRHWVDSIARVLLPPRCLLCGAAGADGRDLCAGCAAELHANAPACVRCAEPLTVSVELCGRCQKKPPPFAAAFVPFRYAWPLDGLEARFKFHGSLAAGRVLAELWIERWREEPPPRPQAVVPVPLHASRLRRRGYNQALELARPLARTLSVPLRLDLLARTRATEAQSELDRRHRKRNVRGAFTAGDVEGLDHIAVLDDVMTTGSTLAECASVLHRAGVSRVDVWALARASGPR